MDESEGQNRQNPNDAAPHKPGQAPRSIGPMGAMGEDVGADQPGNGHPPTAKRSIGPMGEMDALESLPELLPADPAHTERAGDPLHPIESVEPLGSMEQTPFAPRAEDIPPGEPPDFEPLAKPVATASEREDATRTSIPQEIPFAPPSPGYADVPIAEAVARVHQNSEADGLRIEYSSPQAIVPSRRRLPALVTWPVVAAVLAVMVIAGKYQGWELRKQVYKNTAGMHWEDVSNAFTYGKAAIDAQGTSPTFWNRRIFSIYHEIRSSPTGTSDIAKLDYPPLRLTIMSLWTRWCDRNHIGSVPKSGDAFNATEPLLQLNMACEMVSAVLIFALVLLWSRRTLDPDEPDAGWRWPLIGFAVFEAIAGVLFWKYRDVNDVATLAFFYLGAIQLARMVPGLAPALAGTLIFWFNPAVIWNSYAWPQWDVWAFPFLLGALLLASVEWWFSAGLLIAVGAMTKGQLLVASPLFLLWPLLRGQLMPAVRFAGGFMLTFAIIIFPWMLPTTQISIWLAMTAAGLGLLALVVCRGRMSPMWLLALTALAALLVWPWKSSAPLSIRLCAVSLAAMVALSRLAPRRLTPSVYAIALASAIFLTIPLYSAGSDWYAQGYRYGTESFQDIGTTQGTSHTNNLAVLLSRVFSWKGNANTARITIDFDWMRAIKLGWMLPIEMSVRNFMLTLYGICLLLCGIGAAIHSKRRDARLLLCAVTPWLCSFVLLTQLNNRYLVWAAAMSALLPAVGVGMTLLGMIVSIICWIGIAQVQYAKFGLGPDLGPTLAPLSPHLGWALTLAAAVYLYVAIVPGPRRARGNLLPSPQTDG